MRTLCDDLRCWSVSELWIATSIAGLTHSCQNSIDNTKSRDISLNSKNALCSNTLGTVGPAVLPSTCILRYHKKHGRAKFALKMESYSRCTYYPFAFLHILFEYSMTVMFKRAGRSSHISMSITSCSVVFHGCHFEDHVTCRLMLIGYHMRSSCTFVAHYDSIACDPHRRFLAIGIALCHSKPMRGGVVSSIREPAPGLDFQ
jgi:hypothetical protein